MSYAHATALQAAIYDRLTADPAVQAALGGAVHDTLPDGPLADLYAVLGPSDVVDASDVSGAAAVHRVTVSIVAHAGGFAGPKAAAQAVSAALEADPLPVLAEGRLTGLSFERARARLTDGGATRRIDLRFRARVEDI